MSHLLTCTDGSLYAPSVYQLTAWAAARLGVSIRVLHVHDAHREVARGGDLSGAIGFNASADLTEELTRLEETQARLARLKGKAILEDAVLQIAAAGITNVETLQRHGSLVDTLAEMEPAAEMVVLGKRGEHADLAKGHLGSQLQRVIRTSVKPVLVASRAFQPVDRFLLAYDGSPSVLKAVDFLLSSPLLKGLPCHLLRAGKIDDTARHYLEETATKLRQSGADVTVHAIPGPAEEVIAATVKEQAISLLVMGAYGHSRLREFFVGSTTTELIRTCRVPVMMFR